MTGLDRRRSGERGQLNGNATRDHIAELGPVLDPMDQPANWKEFRQDENRGRDVGL